MTRKPEANAVLAAWPYKEGIGAAKIPCGVCGIDCGIDPANVPVIAERQLHVMCLLCVALMNAEERVVVRGRLTGGLPVDEIAEDRRRNN